jgi:hypothetical protein
MTRIADQYRAAFIEAAIRAERAAKIRRRLLWLAVFVLGVPAVVFLVVGR